MDRRRRRRLRHGSISRGRVAGRRLHRRASNRPRRAQTREIVATPGGLPLGSSPPRETPRRTPSRAPFAARASTRTRLSLPTPRSPRSGTADTSRRDRRRHRGSACGWDETPRRTRGVGVRARSRARRRARRVRGDDGVLEGLHARRRLASVGSRRGASRTDGRIRGRTADSSPSPAALAGLRGARGHRRWRGGVAPQRVGSMRDGSGPSTPAAVALPTASIRDARAARQRARG